MGQGESRFSDSQKLLIKEAIWLVYEQDLFSPDEYEIELRDYLQEKFPSNDCARHRLVGPYVPDIVIEDVGVIEVKNVSWKNLDSTRKGIIETYMEKLSLPGLMVNFPHSGFPYLRWYYLDENKEPKLECIETLDSDPSEPTSASQASSNSNTRCSEESAFQASSNSKSGRSQESPSQAWSNSNSGWSQGTALGVGLGFAAAALAVFALAKDEKKDEKKSKDDESD